MFGQTVRRTRLSWSHEDLAEKAAWDINAVSNIEADQTRPQPSTMWLPKQTPQLKDSHRAVYCADPPAQTVTSDPPATATSPAPLSEPAPTFTAADAKSTGWQVPLAEARGIGAVEPPGSRDLSPVTPPVVDKVHRLSHSLGLPQQWVSSVPDAQIALYRSWPAGRRPADPARQRLNAAQIRSPPRHRAADPQHRSTSGHGELDAVQVAIS